LQLWGDDEAHAFPAIAKAIRTVRPKPSLLRGGGPPFLLIRGAAAGVRRPPSWSVSSDELGREERGTVSWVGGCLARSASLFARSADPSGQGGNGQR
jgi:hypothetical protein